MPTVRESICCHECPQAISLMQETELNEQEVPSCITNFPFFEGAILNPWTLRQAYRVQRRMYGGAPEQMDLPE